jgi:hypothetical protein
MGKNTLPVEPVSTGRFWVYVTAKEFNGHRGVTFKLFHESALDSEVYETVLAPGLDRDCPYLRSAVEETFDAAEVDTLREWFSQCWKGPPDFRIEQAPQITGSQMGHSMLPIGGMQGFYMFSKLEDFPLPCEVYGYYDLRSADSDPFDNPWPGRDDAERGCYVLEDKDEAEDDRRILVGGYWWLKKEISTAFEELCPRRSFVSMWDACLYLVLPYWEDGMTEEQAITAYFANEPDDIPF